MESRGGRAIAIVSRSFELPVLDSRERLIPVTAGEYTATQGRIQHQIPFTQAHRMGTLRDQSRNTLA